MSALKLFWFGFELVLLFFMSLFLYILFVYLQLSPPEVSEIEVDERVEVSKNHYTLGPNWLRKMNLAFGKCTLRAVLMSEV